MASSKICLILLLAVVAGLPTGESKVHSYYEDGFELQIVLRNGRPLMVPFFAFEALCIKLTDGAVAPTDDIVHGLKKYQEWARKIPAFHATHVGWVNASSSAKEPGKEMTMKAGEQDWVKFNGKYVVRPLVCLAPPKLRVWFADGKCKYEINWRSRKFGGTFPLRTAYPDGEYEYRFLHYLAPFNGVYLRSDTKKCQVRIGQYFLGRHYRRYPFEEVTVPKTDKTDIHYDIELF